MYQHPIVKPAFHLSWFLLLLGGISLIEHAGWGLVGAAMFVVGLVVLAFTAISIYLKKSIIQEPAWLLLISLIFLAVLIFSQLVFGKLILAVVLATLCVPIILGWSKVKNTGGKKSAPKKKK
jgi:uncharacterized membrane protein YoaK (UPF0700 family)